jgi:hypothetical protein
MLVAFQHQQSSLSAACTPWGLAPARPSCRRRIVCYIQLRRATIKWLVRLIGEGSGPLFMPFYSWLAGSGIATHARLPCHDSKCSRLRWVAKKGRLCLKRFTLCFCSQVYMLLPCHGLSPTGFTSGFAGLGVAAHFSH